MDMRHAKLIVKKYYQEGLEHVASNPNFSDQKKADLTRFIKHKIGHMARCVEIGKKLLRADGVATPEQARQILFGIMVHDIGNFIEMDKEKNVSGAKHGPFGKQLLLERENFLESDLGQRLVMEMTEQHSALDPDYTDNEFVNYGIRVIRDTDKIENITFLLDDPFGPKRAIYYDNDVIDGPISPKVQQAFDEKRLVENKHVQNRSDTLVYYAAWGHDLNLDVSKQLWAENRITERLIELARACAPAVAPRATAPRQRKPHVS